MRARVVVEHAPHPLLGGDDGQHHDPSSAREVEGADRVARGATGGQHGLEHEHPGPVERGDLEVVAAGLQRLGIALEADHPDLSIRQRLMDAREESESCPQDRYSDDRDGPGDRRRVGERRADQAGSCRDVRGGMGGEQCSDALCMATEVGRGRPLVPQGRQRGPDERVMVEHLQSVRCHIAPRSNPATAPAAAGSPLA